MRNLHLLAAALLGASLPGAAARASGGDVVVVGGDRDYPPYEFLDRDGRPAGYNVDLTHAIADVMGMRVEIRLGGWAEMRQALRDRRIDALQGMSRKAPTARSQLAQLLATHDFPGNSADGELARSVTDAAPNFVNTHRRCRPPPGVHLGTPGRPSSRRGSSRRAREARGAAPRGARARRDAPRPPGRQRSRE